MPKPKKQRTHMDGRDSLPGAGLSANAGLYGIPGLNNAGGWDDPAFRHICQVAMEMRASGVELTRETMDAVVKMGRARYEAGTPYTPSEAPLAPLRPFPSREQHAAEGVVYYVRRGEFVKIGTTMRLRDRMRALVPDEVLAVEPGSYPLEKRMHRRFEHLRASFMREYFRMEPDLMEHIARVVERQGPPPKDLLVFGGRE